MDTNRHIVFDPFALDATNECLWRGSQAIKLRPKAFAVLEHLVENPGQLVTKEKLLNAVWPETFVSEAVLKVAIRQIREALGDDPRSPRFIETAHRRGYRFIGRIATSAAPPAAGESRDGGVSSEPIRTADPRRGFVGRDLALARMETWLGKMRDGERQIVFVTGEAGIGKTALVDTFVRRIDADRGVWVSAGQCLEQYGTGEAYLPVLEAIVRLCRQHPQVVHVLRAHAPMWLLQMPSLVSASDRESLGREMLGATRDRMLREMGDALEALTADVPLVLVLEDLHWSDYSTLDLISYLARQRQAAHLMVIGTYRAAELIASGHPLKSVKRELLAKHQCEELPLEYLTQGAVGEYLAVRFPANQFPPSLAALIHERTEGNPLFMVNTIDYLVGDGMVADRDGRWDLVADMDQVKVAVPDSIRQMIEKQIDHLQAEERRILETASVAGAEFSAVAVAAGLAEDVAAVDAACEELAGRHHFIQDFGLEVLPNGEAAGRYGFVHALYRNVLYDCVPASRRAQMHRRIAEHGEAVYGERATEIAGELAMHFERAANYEQAARYLQRAADKAIRGFAYHEAVALSRRGLTLLERLRDGEARTQLELSLQVTLGMPLIATQGYAAPEVGVAYLRARQLCRQVGDTPEISRVLWGLWTFHILGADMRKAREIAEELVQLADHLPYPGLAMRGHWAVETTFMHLGEFRLAVEHFEKALSLFDPEQHRDDAYHYALNPGVAMRCFVAWALWFLGQPDRSLERIQEAVALARELSEPHGLAHALFFAAMLHQLRGEEAVAREYGDGAIALSTEHRLVMYLAMTTVVRGWAVAGRESGEDTIEQMSQAIAACKSTGAKLVRPHFLAQLAEALRKAGRAEEGLPLLEEALALTQSTGERYYEAELYRLKGERVRAHGDLASAETCFVQAIEVARRQHARSLELRATMSLARLYQTQGKQQPAFEGLSAIYGTFTEGLETLDVREAKALLDELSRSTNSASDGVLTNAATKSSPSAKSGTASANTPATIPPEK